MAEAHWYVVHTYSGHEKKVQANIKKIAENRGMEDIILEVAVPMETVVEIKSGKRTEKERKIFPSYVIVKMIMTDESWFVVRNTRGVTGFVGPGPKPIPLSRSEVEDMGLEKRTIITDYEVGDHVKIISGSFSNFEGVVEEINKEKQTVRVQISFFAKETSAEFSFDQVTRLL